MCSLLKVIVCCLRLCSAQMTCFTRNVRHTQAVSLVASVPCGEPRSLRLIKIAPFVCATRLQKSLVNYIFNDLWGFPDNSAGKECACNAGDPGFNPWVGKIPWRRERLPTTVLWPGEFHGQYSPWGCKQSDTTE